MTNPFLRTMSRFPTIAAAVLLAVAAAAPAQSHRFGAKGDHFELDGKPFQILSGEMHYSRIPREYWRARLRMARAMGLNTVATYVFWNVHEPQPGHYDFSGQNDLAAFIRMAGEEHLHVLLRAGPYSCAEWEFGGFPAWLLKDPKMATALRSTDPAFMQPTERWITRLAKEVAPLQIDNGGPIIATQIENEYGNFSNDHAYMEQMRALFVRAGFTKSMLYTVDPSKALSQGMIPGVVAGVNFGTGHAKDGLDALAKLRPGAPLFASEYWPGWFDLWGAPHQTRPIAPQLEDLNYILDHHGSVNIYMVHGGTSFGQMAGASKSTGRYRGNVTSYDYDAPIDEAGHATAKFIAYRDVILAHTHEKPLPIPETTPVIGVRQFALKPSVSLWDTLPVAVRRDSPMTMEELGQSYGYVLYRTESAKGFHGELALDHQYDFATVYLNGKLKGTLDRHYGQQTIALDADGPARLDILVENTGRLNSTAAMRDERKGFRAATLNGEPLLHWEMFSLPMNSVPAGKPGVAVEGSAPRYLSGTFQVAMTGDTYLDVRRLGKGLIWINGHALGRFWNVGPQDTLYVPAPWLHRGMNRVDVFEMLQGAEMPKLSGLTKPILDGPTPTYESDPERTEKKRKDSEFGATLATPADAAKKP